MPTPPAPPQTEDQHREVVHIAASVALIPTARHRVRAFLAGSPRVHDAEHVTGELLVDAIRHSHGTVILHLTHDDAGVRIEVYDQRRHRPRDALLPTDEDAPDPLAVVSLLAEEIGSSGTHGTTYVSTWARLHHTTRDDSADADTDGAIDEETDARHGCEQGPNPRKEAAVPTTR